MKMKKYIVLIVVLLAVSAGFAFQRKDVLLGGYAELISREHKTKNQIVTDLGLYPQVGVFLDEAICLDLIFGHTGPLVRIMNVGAGARLFHKNIYAGASFSVLAGMAVSYYEVTPKLGYLIPIVPNAYLDLQAFYRRALSSNKLEEDYAAVRLGIQVHLGKKPQADSDQ